MAKAVFDGVEAGEDDIVPGPMVRQLAENWRAGQIKALERQLGEKDQAAWAKFFTADALGAEALLLGRRTYEFFARRRPSRSGARADRLDGTPKYVVSSTLADPDWNYSTVINGEPVDAVSKLKRNLGGQIVVHASRPLVAALMEHDLVDELRLIVFPVVLGDGQRIFGPSSDKKPLCLLSTRTAGEGLAVLTYEVLRNA